MANPNPNPNPNPNRNPNPIPTLTLTRCRGRGGGARCARESNAWMRGMLSRGGYALVDRHDNPRCSYCSKVLRARLRLRLRLS